MTDAQVRPGISQIADTPEDQRVPANPADFGYSRFALRIWHGVTLGAFVRIMRGNLRHVHPQRYGLFASVFLFSFGNSALKTMSQLIYGRRIAKVKIEPDPVFILGHWRSGTTWLSQLFDADGRLASPTAMQCFSPETFLGSRAILKAILALTLPKSRPMDNVDLKPESAEEDEHCLTLSGAPTPYRALAFPCNQIDGLQTTPEEMTSAQSALWRVKWIGFLKRVQYVNPGKRLLLKSPLHTLRVPEILHHFPNAKFIHIVRDPYKIRLSHQNSSQAMAATQSFQAQMPDRNTYRERQGKTFVEFHKRYHETRDLIPDGNLVTIRYEDLRSDTISVLRDVYKQLDLGDFATFEPRLAASINAKKDYRTNRYDLPDDLEQEIWTQWRDYFDRYGYDRMTDRT